MAAPWPAQYAAMTFTLLDLTVSTLRIPEQKAGPEAVPKAAEQDQHRPLKELEILVTLQYPTG